MRIPRSDTLGGESGFLKARQEPQPSTLLHKESTVIKTAPSPVQYCNMETRLCGLFPSARQLSKSDFPCEVSNLSTIFTMQKKSVGKYNSILDYESPPFSLWYSNGENMAYLAFVIVFIYRYRVYLKVMYAKGINNFLYFSISEKFASKYIDWVSKRTIICLKLINYYLFLKAWLRHSTTLNLCYISLEYMTGLEKRKGENCFAFWQSCPNS